MIQKICKIRNVGRFVECCPCGDVEFRPLTLIYAENARGKTTLADILRSLRDGEPDHVIGRASLGRTDRPFVEIRLDTRNAVFAGGKWDTTLPNIEIFDASFIHDNIHSGDVVDHDHKKSLYKTVIGNKAVKMAEAVVTLDKLGRVANSYMRELEGQLAPQVAPPLTVGDFVALKAVDDLEAKTAAQASEVASLSQSKAIADAESLVAVTLPDPPAGIEVLLAKQLPDLTEEVEARVKAHIAELKDPGAENWLSTGTSYATSGRCPFCNSDTRTNALVNHYSSYFSEAYRSLKESIAATLVALATWFDQDALLEAQGTLASNKQLIEFWKTFIPLGAIPFEFSDMQATIGALKGALQEALTQKQASPLESIHLDPTAKVAYENFRLLVDKAHRYTAYIAEANIAIAAKKVATATGNLKDAQLALAKLRHIPACLIPETAKLCKAYLKCQTDIADYAKKKQDVKTALDEEAPKLFAKYSDAINLHLGGFGASFSIGKLSPSYKGGSPSSSYHIIINNVPVAIGDAATPTNMPSFKNTMSAGDKSALALAFFLAKVDSDEGLADKIIVLDDPVSSQDRFRSSYTEEQISRLMNCAKEVIVLSHDSYFLRRLWDKVPDKGIVRPLAVVRNGETSSTIGSWDIETETAGEYYQNYCVLVRFLSDSQGVNKLHVIRCIRQVLEGNLRVRFPGHFTKGWLGNFIEKIRDENDPELEGMKELVSELDGVNNYCKKYYHLDTLGAVSPQISDTELITFVKRTLRLLPGINAADPGTAES